MKTITILICLLFSINLLAKNQVRTVFIPISTNIYDTKEKFIGKAPKDLYVSVIASPMDLEYLYFIDQKTKKIYKVKRTKAEFIDKEVNIAENLAEKRIPEKKYFEEDKALPKIVFNFGINYESENAKFFEKIDGEDEEAKAQAFTFDLRGLFAFKEVFEAGLYLHNQRGSISYDSGSEVTTTLWAWGPAFRLIYPRYPKYKLFISGLWHMSQTYTTEQDTFNFEGQTLHTELMYQTDWLNKNLYFNINYKKRWVEPTSGSADGNSSSSVIGLGASIDFDLI